MYPRNAASPERIAVGQVILIADGTIQTSGVSITVRPQAGAEASGGGTTAYGADGTVYYTPTQAETNYTSFVVIASKASCFSAAQTIITTASATSGKVVLSGETHTSAVIPNVTLVDTTTTNTDMRGTDNAALAATALSTATWTSARAGYLDNINGHTAQTGDVFAALPTNFVDLAITATTGRVDIASNNDKSGYTISGIITTLDGLDTAQDSQHSTTQSSIAALNNLSAAQVNAEVDTALADYDAPTKAELDSAVSLLATASAVATAQADLDIITGADGAALASTQQSITFQPITVTAADGINNITLDGSGNADGVEFTRSGSGSVFGANWAAAIQKEATDALNAYDAPTKAELDSGLAALSIPTASAIRAEIDSNSTKLADIVADTNELQTDNVPGLISTLQAAIPSVSDILTTQMVESYAPDGTAPTITQALMMIQQRLGDFSISGSTITVKKVDGLTTAATYTLGAPVGTASTTRST